MPGQSLVVAMIGRGGAPRFIPHPVLGCRRGCAGLWCRMDMVKTRLLLLVALCFGLGAARAAGTNTAFALMREGNRYIGEQAKDRVVQIRSDKSIGGLTPNIWYVVYHDPTATLKAVEVKFGGGKMMDVKRPLRVLEHVNGGSKELDKEKLKIDSDEAIKLAAKEPVLENLVLKAVSAKLENSDSGPVWKVRLWAQKLRRKEDNADLGEVVLSAQDGKIVKNDLHIERVD